jgi:hypothetical protein
LRRGGSAQHGPWGRYGIGPTGEFSELSGRMVSNPMRPRAAFRPGMWYYGFVHSRTFHSAEAWLAGFVSGPSTIVVFQKIAMGLL